MVPTFTYSFVNFENSKTFNPHKTPPYKTGIITEKLWLRKEFLCSFHLTHSVAAIGKEAEYLIRNHERVSAVGENSPFHKLTKKGIHSSFRSISYQQFYYSYSYSGKLS